MLGLVRGLVDWLPTSADWAGYVAGPVVLAGYVVGSIPFGELVATRRFRRQLEHGRFPTARWQDVDTADVIAALLSAVVTLAVATVAWDIGLEVSPRARFSAVGTFSNQALGAWVSIALWTGTAAMIGSMAPLWTAFRRGGSGIAPAAALLVVYTPLLAAAGIAVGAIAFGVAPRWRVALAAGLGAVVTLEYVLWISDTQVGWGITNGPETGLWAAVVSVLLVGRRSPD